VIQTILIYIFITLISNTAFSQVITTYQAEDAVLYHAAIETEHSGYTGTGYVNYDNEVGGYIEWTIAMASSGNQTFYIRYANGSTNNRYLQINVNSIVVEDSMSFPGTVAWTNWSIDSVTVSLNEGINTFRATAITLDGGPNVDKMDVTGEPGIMSYSLNMKIFGEGEVDINPPDSIFMAGTIVTLTAQATLPYSFYKWFGDLEGGQNPDTLIMNSDKDVTAVFLQPSDTMVVVEDNPVGFASVNALGQNGTYGGECGETVYISNAQTLDSFFYARKDPNFNQNYPPMNVIIQGNISGFSDEMMDIKETYDLTILGDGNDAEIEGFGFNIFRSHNIIVRNLKFKDCPDDAINITDSLSHHIWINYCTLTDSPAVDPNGSNHDGLIDIKHGASYITVSWCHFNNHSKTCLLGHSDSNELEDVGRLKTTYHHNWFNGTYSRHPRVRFAKSHVYNNFYDGKNFMAYGIASTCNADVLVEYNFFSDVLSPTHSGYGSSPPGDVIERENIFVNSGEPETAGSVFEPTSYYSYITSNPGALPIIIPKFSGSGRIGSPVNVEDDVNSESHIAADFRLYQNYPNPFNPSTKIKFFIPFKNNVQLIIYDILGNQVAQIINETLDEGFYEREFTAANIASGLYFYTLKTEILIQSKKMILLK